MAFAHLISDEASFPVDKIGAKNALIVGARVYGKKPDRRSLYQKALGIDLSSGEGVDYVHDLEQPLPAEYGEFDHVDCFSVMEHCKHPWLMAKNIESLLPNGGTLLFSAPFVWREHAYPDDYWRFTKSSLSILFPSMRWEVLYYTSNKKVVSKPSAFNDKDGLRWMSRTEVVGFGVKCDSAS